MDEESRVKLVDPVLVGGFRDYGPSDMILKNRILSTVATVYEEFGFDPLDTATVHLKRVLFGAKGEASMPYFEVAKRPKLDESTMALRYDLTVSLARYVAEHLDRLPHPFKRWQWGKVFRGEKPQAGRFCEFIQCDADIMFAESVLADAEIVAVIYECLHRLGVKRFQINVNDRKICNGLVQRVGFDPTQLISVLRVIDKIEKIGLVEAERELARAASDDFPGGLGLGIEKATGILTMTQISGSNNDRLAQLLNFMNGVAMAEEGAFELRQLLIYAQAMGVPEGVVVVNPSMVRGLEYYTGPVFEAVLLDKPAIGSVFAGGRFDDLVSRFCPAKVPGTGASIGIDRFLTAAQELKLFGEPQRSVVDVMIAYMKEEYIPEALKIATELRGAGKKVLVYTGSDRAFNAQFTRAVREEIPWLIILGEREMTSAQVMFKDMRTGGNQGAVPREALVTFVKGLTRD